MSADDTAEETGAEKHSCGPHCQRPLCIAGREVRELRDAITALESALADYKGAVSQAQDALGEYWVTSPNLPAACRQIYAAIVNRQTEACMMREHLARADVAFSDDMVEAVGQLVDEMMRRGRLLRDMKQRLANALKLFGATDDEIERIIKGAA